MCSCCYPISFYKPARVPLAFCSAGIQIISLISDEKQPKADKIKKVAFFISTLFASIYFPFAALTLTTGYQMLQDGQDLIEATKKGETEKLIEKLYDIFSAGIYFGSIYSRRPEAVVASLLTQVLKEGYQSYTEFKENHILEGCAKILTALLRTYQARDEISRAYLRQFGKEITQKEWDALVEEADQQVVSKQTQSEPKKENIPPLKKISLRANKYAGHINKKVDLSEKLKEKGFSEVVRDIQVGRTVQTLSFDMKNIEFVKVDFSKVYKDGFSVKNVRFIECKMNQVVWEYVELQEVEFRTCQLAQGIFNACNGRDVSFIDSDLTGVSFFGSIFERLTIDSSKIYGASFMGMQLKDSIIRSCDLVNVILGRASFKYIDCTEHKMTKPVIALSWDGYWSKPLVDVIEDHGALPLRIPVNKNIFDGVLDQEVKGRLANLKEIKISRIHSIVTDPISSPLIDKIKDVGQEVMSCSSGLILSGGGNIEKNLYGQHVDSNILQNYYRTLLEGAMIFESLKEKKSIMGICRGLQMINVALGGSIKDVGYQKGVKGFEFSDNLKGEFFKKLLEGKVQGFLAHYQGVDRLAEGLNVALSHNGIVKAFLNDDHSIIGTQFHPEKYFEAQKELKELFFGDVDLGDLLPEDLEHTLSKGSLFLNKEGKLQLTPEAQKNILTHLLETLNKEYSESKALAENKKIFSIFFDKIYASAAQ